MQTTTIFFPTTFGDIRLEGQGNGTILRTTKLSGLEEKAVRSLLKDYAAETDRTERAKLAMLPLDRIEESAFALALKWDKAHRAAMKALKPGRDTITAYKLEMVGAQPSAIQLAATGKPPEGTVAVTTEAPPKGCPMRASEVREVRADRVLREFLTALQVRDLDARGAVAVAGGDTGHVYRVAHRHSALACSSGNLVTDLTTGRRYCSEVTLLPPSEELLALMLVLRFRERRWIRGQA
jgi:hypothetical protein